jgi:DNA modification methylase
VVGDCRESLRAMPARSVQTCVTSPPYFGLRDYGTRSWEGGSPECEHEGSERYYTEKTAATSSAGAFSEPGEANAARLKAGRWREGGACVKCGAQHVDKQIGLEPTPDEFVAALVSVFREVRRVLRDDGTVWLNLGDSYNNRAVNRPSSHQGGLGFESEHLGTSWRDHAADGRARMSIQNGDLKEKDLIGIPWMVAFALRADGWYLRSDIIWNKPNPMPESVTDRPTKAHEYLFLLSKGPRYFYDADAIREAHGSDYSADVVRLAGSIGGERPDGDNFSKERRHNGGDPTPATRAERAALLNPLGRNRRSVWTVATQPYAGAHFATFPPKLIEPCILAGTSPKACGVCGAPWRRVVERTAMVVQASERRNGWQEEQPGLARTQTDGTMVEPPTSRTVGWEPSCEHDDDTGRSLVLDPFAGSGTVGVVCGWQGRDFIGCELNENYAQMARERIALEGRPGGKPNGHEPVRIIDGQMGLEIG